MSTGTIHKKQNRGRKPKSTTVDDEYLMNATDECLMNATETYHQGRALELLKGEHSFSQIGLNKALVSACRHGHKYLIQTLISLGADVHVKDVKENTPLLICAENGFTDIVRFLLLNNANVNAVNSAGNTALILSLRSSGSVEMVKVLLKQKGININHQNVYGYTALMKAVEVNDIDTMKMLLEESYNKNYRKQSSVYGFERYLHDEITNNKGQTAENMADQSGLGNVFRSLSTAINRKMCPLVVAVEENDTESFNILLSSLFLDTNDMVRSVRKAFVKIFTNYELKDVKSFTDNEIMMIDQLIKHGAYVNTYLDYGFPLTVAVKAGNIRLVELLCEHGAKITIQGFGDGPLYTAVRYGRHDLIEMLLSYYDYGDLLYFPGSIIDCALSHNHIQCAKLLIQHGATLNIDHSLDTAVKLQMPEYMTFLFENYEEETMLHFRNKTEHLCSLLISAVEGGNLEIIGQILDAGADVNQSIESGVVPLVKSKNGEVAHCLVQRGADVNQTLESAQYGSSSIMLHILREKDNYNSSTMELILVLIENGASVNEKGRDGRTPIMVAASKEESVNMLQLLLDHGAVLNNNDEEGNTALLHAAIKNCSQNISFLLLLPTLKDFLNTQNHEGLTALMCAAVCRNLNVVLELVSHGADVNLKDVKGNTALLHAVMEVSRDTTEILTTLVSAGSDINYQNNAGLSPLMLAASRSKKYVLQILLNAGADVNAVSNNDLTKTALTCLLDISCFRENTKNCMKYLLERGASTSFVSPLALINIILNGYSEVIPEVIQCGLGPSDINSHEIPHRVVEPGLDFHVSPLCMALLVENVGLARYFMGNLFLTNSDMSSLMYNKNLRRILERKKYQECLNFLDEMFSQPISLFQLSFVVVSSAVGTSPERENRVNLLPLTQAMKDKLLFKTDTARLTIPALHNSHPLVSYSANVRSLFNSGYNTFSHSFEDDKLT